MTKLPPDSEIYDAISNFFTKHKYSSFIEDPKVKEITSIDAIKGFLTMAIFDYTESLKTSNPYKSVKDVINEMYKDACIQSQKECINVPGETLPEMALNYILLNIK